MGAGRKRRHLISQGGTLVVTAAALYLLAPGLLEVFASWDQVSQLDLRWLLAVGVAQAIAFFFVWALQRQSLRTTAWLPVVTSQLAGNTASRIIPGGPATGAAVQYRMLRSAGVSTANASVGLAAAGAIQLATTLAMPVVALPGVLFGAPVPRGLLTAALLGAGLFAVLALVTIVAFVKDAPLRVIGRAVDTIRRRLPGMRRPTTPTAMRLLAERDALRNEFGPRGGHATFYAIGRATFDFVSLVTATAAFGIEARFSLLLLAFASATILGMVPITPGGLGFVEAGLTGTLALAGVPAAAAVSIALLYRLFSFWLPIPLGLVAGAFHSFKFAHNEPGPEAA